MPRTSAQLRRDLVDALTLDLVGPDPSHTHASETLAMAPSRFYLTGFLVPYEASEDQRTDPTSQEAIAAGSDSGAGDDDETPEAPSARRARFPSSMGLSLLVGAAERSLEVTADWGDYEVTTAEEASSASAPAGTVAAEDAGAHPRRELWQRVPRRARLTVSLDKGRQDLELPGAAGLRLAVSARKVSTDKVQLVPEGTRAVSVFLVNQRPPNPDAKADERFVFQAQLTVRSKGGFVARPNLRGRNGKDWDEAVADLQYRDVSEFAVGHGVASHAFVTEGRCHELTTAWIPAAEVERVVPADVPGVERGMEALAGSEDAAVLAAKLRPLAEAYGTWLADQARAPLPNGRHQDVAAELLRRAELVRRRIQAGVELLEEDPAAFQAFRIANRAMALQQRRRAKDLDGRGPAPEWRPFQLAFLLLNLRGIARPAHADREVVDLLFFPTGGGKTEAYLGLAAFTLVLRRLTRPGLGSAGVAVLMRYTLRLLTLDQLSRAATLICALELLRQEDVEALGSWPFEIGLWVGQAATPNRMGRKGDGDAYSARARTVAYHNDDKKPVPIPIERCPWCDQRLVPQSFTLIAHGKPNPDHPTDLRVMCMNRSCDFSARKNRPIPIVAVDEPIYRRLPCFVIATVDKLAGLPWVGETGALFGHVDRADKEGFYGAAEPNRGSPLPAPLPPPELIIQDELHLISGPLGTMAGLYETAIDALASRTVDGRTIRPKVIASTATVRRAERQIHALFARREVDIFPPPGPDLADSFFAQTIRASDPDHPEPGTAHARLYAGVAAQGRSLKVVLLRTYLALLGAAQRATSPREERRTRRTPPIPTCRSSGTSTASESSAAAGVSWRTRSRTSSRSTRPASASGSARARSPIGASTSTSSSSPAERARAASRGPSSGSPCPSRRTIASTSRSPPT